MQFELTEQKEFPLPLVWTTFLKQINRELIAFDELEIDEDRSFHEQSLVEIYVRLQAFFEQFLLEDEKGLMNFLYRVDIKEATVVMAAQNSSKAYSQILTDCFLNRCYQKAVTKMRYSS